MSRPASLAPAGSKGALRVGVMSDIHLEFEPAYWQGLERTTRRGDSSQAADALRRRAELQQTPGHPNRGPDLRGLKGDGVDLLLLAGDMHLGIDSVAYAEAAARYLGCPACLCMGNHEAYGFDVVHLIPALREAAARTGGRVSFLERERRDFAVRGLGVAVLGAALWTDYEVNDDRPSAMAAAARALNDHRLVRHGGHP